MFCAASSAQSSSCCNELVPRLMQRRAKVTFIFTRSLHLSVVTSGTSLLPKPHFLGLVWDCSLVQDYSGDLCSLPCNHWVSHCGSGLRFLCLSGRVPSSWFQTSSSPFPNVWALTEQNKCPDTLRIENKCWVYKSKNKAYKPRPSFSILWLLKMAKTQSGPHHVPWWPACPHCLQPPSASIWAPTCCTKEHHHRASGCKERWDKAWQAPSRRHLLNFSLQGLSL